MTELPSHLKLARKWMVAAGDKVEPWEGDLPDGSKGVALVVTHGSITLRLVPQADLLLVFAGFGIPADARKKLGGLPPDVRKKLLFAFRLELQSCARVGGVYFPQDAQEISAIETFVVTELMAISEADPGSRNRLMDAVQEVTNTGIRGMQVFGVATADTGVSSGTVGMAKPPPPPPGIYG